MSTADAKRLTVIALVFTLGLVTASSFKQGKGLPSARMAAGVVFAGVFLAAGAEVVPELAGPMAAILLAVAIFNTAPDVFPALAGRSQLDALGGQLPGAPPGFGRVSGLAPGAAGPILPGQTRR